LVITVPTADLAALKAITTTAADAHGYLSIRVADRTWLLPRVLQPFTGPHFELAFPSRNQALQIQPVGPIWLTGGRGDGAQLALVGAVVT